jgi:hypothetical protein
MQIIGFNSQLYPKKNYERIQPGLLEKTIQMRLLVVQGSGRLQRHLDHQRAIF